MDVLSAATSSPESPAMCYLLSLPTELRCHIWMLTLNSDSDHEDDDGQVNLLTASPPDLDLMLTCQLIHSEAYDDFVTGYQRFLATRHFVIQGPKDMKLDFVYSLNERRLALITKLTLVGQIIDFQYEDGIWSSSHCGKTPSDYLAAWGVMITPAQAIKVANRRTPGWSDIHPQLRDNDHLWPLYWGDQECVFRELPWRLSKESLLEVKTLGEWEPLTRLELGALLQRFLQVENER